MCMLLAGGNLGVEAEELELHALCLWQALVKAQEPALLGLGPVEAFKDDFPISPSLPALRQNFKASKASYLLRGKLIADSGSLPSQSTSHTDLVGQGR